MKQNHRDSLKKDFATEPISLRAHVWDASVLTRTAGEARSGRPCRRSLSPLGRDRAHRAGVEAPQRRRPSRRKDPLRARPVHAGPSELLRGHAQARESAFGRFESQARQQTRARGGAHPQELRRRRVAVLRGLRRSWRPWGRRHVDLLRHAAPPRARGSLRQRRGRGLRTRTRSSSAARSSTR